jgi:hypothetical protein
VSFIYILHALKCSLTVCRVELKLTKMGYTRLRFSLPELGSEGSAHIKLDIRGMRVEYTHYSLYSSSISIHLCSFSHLNARSKKTNALKNAVADVEHFDCPPISYPQTPCYASMLPCASKNTPMLLNADAPSPKSESG